MDDTYKSIKERPWYAALYKDEFANKEFELVEGEDGHMLIDSDFVNTAVIDWIVEAEDNGQFGTTLFHDFLDLADTWNDEIFDSIDKRIRQVLKTFLRNKGIYIPTRSRDAIPVQLAHLVTIDTCPEWPEAELKEMKQIKGFKCRQTQSDNNPPYFSYPPLPQTNYPPLPLLPQGPTLAQQNINALTNLAKLYTQADKFTGEKYDVLNHKLVIFKDLCAKVGIQPSQPDRYKLAVSTMLAGKASDYYYNSIAPLGDAITFEGVIGMLGDYFHTSKNFQLFLNEWRTIMLKDVIATNSKKTLA